jgi:mono/diheme cytochrome c family protein
MVWDTRTLVAGSVIVWAAAIALATPVSSRAAAQKTTNDGVYSKAQADSAKASYNKICADCHAFTVAAKKRPADLPLGDEPFLKKWNGRSLDELITLIVMTMPNDGSAVVTDAEAVDLVAYILHQNGFPAGPDPLTKSSASAVMALPKK